MHVEGEDENFSVTFEFNDENSGVICANNVNSIHKTNKLYLVLFIR